MRAAKRHNHASERGREPVGRGTVATIGRHAPGGTSPRAEDGQGPGLRGHRNSGDAVVMLGCGSEAVFVCDGIKQPGKRVTLETKAVATKRNARRGPHDSCCAQTLQP